MQYRARLSSRVLPALLACAVTTGAWAVSGCASDGGKKAEPDAATAPPKQPDPMRETVRDIQRERSRVH